MELAQIDMIYSLLSMLNTDDKEHISRTLLGMSTCRESCIAMRQAGCMSLLVQLIHGCPDNAASRGVATGPCNINLSGAGSRVARQRAAAALHNLVHCLPDEKWRRREARVLRLLEIVREYSDAQQQRMQPSSSTAKAQAAPIDSSRVGPAVAALMKLSFDEDHRHAITVLGGLQAVSELLVVDLDMFPIVVTIHPSAMSLNIRRFGCMTLTNLTFGDVTNKALLCSMPTTLKAVVALLGFLENEDIVQAAGSVLRNLSWSADPPSKAALREAGAVKQLIGSVMLVKREPTRTAVFSALWNVSAHLSENKADICCTEGALDFIAVSLILSGSIGESAGGVLRNISSHIAVNNDYREVLRRRGSFEVLVNQLKSSNLTTVSNACGALWNLSAKCPEDQQTLWELGAVPNLQALTNSKHQMIATAATAAIRNLQFYKQQFQSGENIKLNKSGSENAENLSSSFPGTGRHSAQQQHSLHGQNAPQRTPTHAASTSVSSPFSPASSEKGASINRTGTASAVNSAPQSAKNKEGEGKASILYSDTPNSNVVHLNYLHMLATRGNQASMPPPPPPGAIRLKGDVSSATSSPMNQHQRPLLSKVPSVGHQTPQDIQGKSPFSALPRTTNLDNNEEEEDDEPTNFGQRFQEDQEDETNKTGQPQSNFVYPGVPARKQSQSNTSPNSTSSSHNNENNPNHAVHSTVSKPTGHKIVMQIKQQPQHQVKFSSEQTPMMFSRRSSVDSLNSIEVPSIRSDVVSEYSRVASGVISPAELPESPGGVYSEQHRPQHSQHQHHQSAFRSSTNSAPNQSAFVTPQPIIRSKLAPTSSAPLTRSEDAYPAVDSYPDEAERPIVYATEDTPAVLSHATSLSNLTTPGYETPAGTFSPVRAVGTDRPVSPPTAANMRLMFRKPVEPEPVEDEVYPFYTEDTPCHLSASSSLSSLSVMSHASSRRSATTTPLRQKVFALQSGVQGPPSVFGTAPGTGGALLHPRVFAAASKNADPYMQKSPFVASGFNQFVGSGPRQDGVLLEESEDSHNVSGLSQEQVGTRDISLHEEVEDDSGDVHKPLHHESDHDEMDEVVEHNQHNSEDEYIREKESDDGEESDTEDLIQQLISTALENPENPNINQKNNCEDWKEPAIPALPQDEAPAENDQLSALTEQIAQVQINEPNAESGTDLDIEPSEKEVEVLDNCINSVLSPEKPAINKLQSPSLKKQIISPSTQSPCSRYSKRNSLTVVSGTSKLLSPQKDAKGISQRRKSSTVKLGSAETSPLAADSVRSASPGSASRGGSSSGGGSTVRQVRKNQSPHSASAKKQSQSTSAAAKRTPVQKRRSRSRGEDSQTSYNSPPSQSSGSKASPSNSQAANLKATGSAQNAPSANNSKRWNFSTRPNPIPGSPIESQQKCCKHHQSSESKQTAENQPGLGSPSVWRHQGARKGPSASGTNVDSNNNQQANSGQQEGQQQSKSSRRVLMTTV